MARQRGTIPNALREIEQALDQSDRQGAPTDQPEGSRYVVISDTAISAVVTELRKIREAIEHPRQTAERENAEFFKAIDCSKTENA